jgi:hypothetical protein
MLSATQSLSKDRVISDVRLGAAHSVRLDDVTSRLAAPPATLLHTRLRRIDGAAGPQTGDKKSVRWCEPGRGPAGPDSGGESANLDLE